MGESPAEEGGAQAQGDLLALHRHLEHLGVGDSRYSGGSLGAGLAVGLDCGRETFCGVLVYVECGLWRCCSLGGEVCACVAHLSAHEVSGCVLGCMG